MDPEHQKSRRQRSNAENGLGAERENSRILDPKSSESREIRVNLQLRASGAQNIAQNAPRHPFWVLL